MTKKDEAEALGTAMLKTVAAATREAAGEKLTGHAKALNDLLDEVAAQQQRLTLKIYRKGYGMNASVEEFIAPLYNVDPEMLRESGVEPMIQQYAGGGNYRIVITAPGVQMRSIPITIAGEPLAPKPERDLRAMQAGSPVPPGFPMPIQGVAGPGFNAGTPGAAQYFGIPGQFGHGQMQSPLADAALLMNMINQQKPQAADSDELKAMRAQIEELKLQKAAADADRSRIESERRSDAQIAELKAQMEKLSAPKSDQTDKLLAIVAALGPVIGGIFQAREQTQAAIAAAQAAAAQQQSNLMLTLFGSQKDAGAQSLEVAKMMLAQPRETETDRMRGIMDIAASSMSTTMGLTQAMLNQMQAMQPGERPPWMEILMTLIENASAMGQAALEAHAHKVADGEGEDEAPEVRRIPAVEVKRMPGAAAAAATAAQEPGIEDAAAAAATAAQESLITPDGDARVAGVAGSEEEVNEEGMQIPAPDFKAGAFKIIFDKIQEKDGDLHEVAFRVWKHASSGDKDALNWVRNPWDYTIIVLDAMARRGEILVTAERIQQIGETMVELFAHFRSGYGALEYIQKHKLNISLPKRLVAVPLPPAEPGEAYYQGGENQPQQVEQEVVEGRLTTEDLEKAGVSTDFPQPNGIVPEPEQPKEPVAPTPSFGSSPPPQQPLLPNVPTPGIDAPVPTP